MMPFVIVAAVSVFSFTATEHDSLSANSLASEVPALSGAPTRSTTAKEPSIGELIKKTVITPSPHRLNNKGTKTAKVESVPVAAVNVSDNTPDDLGLSGMTLGVDDRNSTDWVK
jgi:hypothetical protein